MVSDLGCARHNVTHVDQICYSKSVIQDVYQLFHTRMNNFKTVYLHKTSKAIEYMIVDMLLKGMII